MRNGRMDRRRFIATGCSLLAASAVPRVPAQQVRTTQPSPEGFFSLGRRKGHWFLLDPEGKPFFTIGLNHIDPAALRYLENIDIWRKEYGASIERWLKESVRPNLRGWGFNTVGWVQEVVTRAPTNHRHSRNFTYEEYQWLGMPYCHMLPFVDFHQWEVETRNPDLKSSDFEEWCDFVARQECAQLADDPKLIGYFYVDCPTWVHTRPGNEWRGPLFDPKRLESESGRRELFELASRYYQVTHDAVRRYDQHHLIFGDRYEGRAPLPEEVVKAALPFVDVLSFQHFSDTDRIRQDFERWHAFSGKPMLLADAARHRSLPDGYRGHDPRWYRETLTMLRELSCSIGFHLCGAYVRNRCRRCGLLDDRERPDQVAVEAISRANYETVRWLDDFLSG